MAARENLRFWCDPELSGIQFAASRVNVRRQGVHRHQDFELSVHDQDVVVRSISGNIAVPAGMLVRIAAGVWHAVEAGCKHWNEWRLHCGMSVAQALLSDEPRDVRSSDEYFAVSAGSEPSVEMVDIKVFSSQSCGAAFLQAHRALQEAYYENAAVFIDHSHAVLREILRYTIPLESEAQSAMSISDPKLAVLYQLIADQFRQPLTLEEMGQVVGWHPNYLLRRCREKLGFTPHELLIGHRLECARDLVAAGASVAAAAVEAGFFDQAHLHHAYIRVYGTYPREGRQSRNPNKMHAHEARSGA